VDRQSTPCVIDSIIAAKAEACIIFQDNDFIAFLDHRPLFPGHTLLAPKTHVKTLTDLNDELIPPLFLLGKKIAQAVQIAMKAQGIFIAMNNVVSQSIPHLHVHIVPRNKGDGLKGFFWPRQKYRDAQHMLETQEKIKRFLGS
jgi:histidine triad (HIT) family protein